MNDNPPAGAGRRRPDVPPGERIAKVMARAGVASRRDCEKIIEAGRVMLNGTPLTSPAVTVTPRDIILVDGQPLAAREPARLFRFHKPTGLVTTAKDPEGRKTVFDALPAGLPRLISVGRLDLNSEGLLLLTNDGGLARVLELPATGWTRTYRVRVHGQASQDALDTLRDGISVDGVRYGPVNARLERIIKSNAWVRVALQEGKNREIRRLMEHLGLQVTRLLRLGYGPFQLGNLAPGAIEEVPYRALTEQLGGLCDIGPPPLRKVDAPLAAGGGKPARAKRQRAGARAETARAKPNAGAMQPRLSLAAGKRTAAGPMPERDDGRPLRRRPKPSAGDTGAKPAARPRRYRPKP